MRTPILLSLLLWMSACLLPLHAQEKANERTDAYFLHTVEKGQGLYGIASMYRVSQQDIIRLNPGRDKQLRAGQTLRIPQGAQANTRFHTIQAKETLYGLSVKYGVTAKKICEANPGLSADNFRIGRVVAIPAADEAASPTTATSTTPAGPAHDTRDGSSRCRDMHRVEKKETLFSVSRKYGISQDELVEANPELKKGMKKGMFLCIPYPKQATPATTDIPDGRIPTDRELFDQNRPAEPAVGNRLKAALILPFGTKEASSTETARMVEYYEGFLLAADSLKRKGLSMDLYVYDSGDASASVEPLLRKPELKEMDILFGPMYGKHIGPMAAFARQHEIPLVVPFTSKCVEVYDNPYVVQINTPQSYLYSEVYEHFVRKFGRANVVFLKTEHDDADKTEFVDGLRHELEAHGIRHTTLEAQALTAESLQATLADGQENIFIPTSGSQLSLTRILPQLVVLCRENPEQHISLFGYPEWQTYTKDHLENFYELDTYFYSSFYTNNLFPQAVEFTRKYRTWYGKDMMHSYPKFGMLGFDTGFFFLKAMADHKGRLADGLNATHVTSIQTGFKFERVNNWGGFINRKVFFVHFTKDFELIKLDFE